jgi:branched-chain amino acid transport system substrate-binding protein
MLYEERGYRRVATLAEDYSYPHGQVGGFLIEFCRAGGKIAKKLWVALGKRDFGPIIDEMPTDVDALFVALAGTDAIHFLEQYAQVGRSLPLIGGTNTLDQFVLSTTGVLSEWLVGMVSAGPVADDNPTPSWQQFVHAYNTHFPKGLKSPSHITQGNCVNTKAALLALSQVDGDLSDGQARFKHALATLEFETPTGPVRLDHNRNAIATNFLTEVAQKPDGTLYSRLVKAIPEVNQTLGINEAEYLEIGQFNRDNPNCI